MEIVEKRGRGRPKGTTRKEPTFIKGFRFRQSFKNFFDNLENANKFMIDTIKNTKEYKEFITKIEAEKYKNQPNLFTEL